MRAIQPCFVKLKHGDVSSAYDSVSLPDLLVLLFSSMTLTLSTLYIMPAFVPNQYMLDAHSDKGQYDWEIYAWCLRDAIARAGEFTLFEMDYKDRNAYLKFMNKKTDVFEYNGKKYTASD